MRSFTAYALVLFATLVFAPGAAAQQPDPEFVKARQARSVAIQKGDKATFDRMTTANFLVVNARGVVETREQRVGRADKPLPGGGGTGGEEEKVSVYGDTVVLTWKQGNNRFIEVWVKEGGMWKVAAVQMTPIAPAQ
jgi:hypothetical protein